MTQQEMNKLIPFLFNGVEGDYVENNGYVAECTFMCGGKWLLYTSDGEMFVATSNIEEIVNWLKKGDKKQ